MTEKERSKKLLLIDGYSILNRAFYGIPLLTNAKGLHTNAVMGFINILLNAYNEFHPDYIITALDMHQKTFRHEKYAAYKGTRKPMPGELLEQVEPLSALLHAMNIKTAALAGYEADDIIGTYARTAHEAGDDVVILSGDRDLLQLATDETLVVIPKTKQTGNETEKYYASDVAAKYGVTPKEFIDMKALMGDASDNIPGIPGIGEKTASAIISKYGSLENAYEHVDEITPKRAKENLKEYIEQGRMSLDLATIRTDAPVETDYHDCHISSQADLFNKASYALLKELELNRILEKFDTKDIETAGIPEYVIKDLAEFPDILPEKCGIYVDEYGTLIALSTQGVTTVYKCPEKTSQANGILMSDVGGHEGWPKNFLKACKSAKEIYCFDLKALLHIVEKCEDKPDDTSHTSKITYRTSEIDIYAEGIHIYDVGLMAYLINPLLSSYTYDTVSKDYLNTIIPSKNDLIGNESVGDCLACEAAMSAKVALEAADILKDKLESEGMDKLFYDVENPLACSLYYMEREGVEVNIQTLRELSKKLLDMSEKLQKDIYEEAGEEFNINSPKQLGSILFEKLHLPHGKKTKTGYSTSADILEKLASDYPVVSKILYYRQVVKLRSTYAEGLVSCVCETPTTDPCMPYGRIHGTFNQTVTATGRISSTKPNLQNIPIRTELGQEIRKAFVAKEGCVLVDADYSQIELRLLAHLSNDKGLIEAYHTDADIHRITASKVFNTPIDEVTPQQRRNAKAVNFGIVYGISSFGLGQDLSISSKQAEKYIEQYFETYPQVSEYLERTVRQAKLDGYVTTIFGRRRPIPELSSTNFMQRKFGERVAMNSPLQGSAADIMKIAMINVDARLRREGLSARVVLQIHDELLVEAPVSETEQVKKILDEEMKNAAVLRVPLEVEINTGSNWFEAH